MSNFEVRVCKPFGCEFREAYVEAAEGVAVAAVVPDGNGAAAGITAGCILYAVNGDSVEGMSFDDTIDLLMEAGDVVDLAFWIPGDEEEEETQVAVSAQEEWGQVDEELGGYAAQEPEHHHGYEEHHQDYDGHHQDYDEHEYGDQQQEQQHKQQAYDDQHQGYYDEQNEVHSGDVDEDLEAEGGVEAEDWGLDNYIEEDAYYDEAEYNSPDGEVYGAYDYAASDGDYHASQQHQPQQQSSVPCPEALQPSRTITPAAAPAGTFRSREGWMEKLGGQNKDKWQKRYFVLTWPLLRYYSNEKKKDERGKILVQGATIVQFKAGRIKQYSFGIQPRSGDKDKVYVLCCKTPESRHGWVKVLTQGGNKLFSQATAIMSGDLFQLSGGLAQSWKKRFCDVDAKGLHVFVDRTQKESKGAVNIKDANIIIIRQDKYSSQPYAFAILNGKTKKIFAAPSAKQRVEWLKAFRAKGGLLDQEAASCVAHWDQQKRPAAVKGNASMVICKLSLKQSGGFLTVPVRAGSTVLDLLATANQKLETKGVDPPPHGQKYALAMPETSSQLPISSRVDSLTQGYDEADPVKQITLAFDLLQVVGEPEYVRNGSMAQEYGYSPQQQQQQQQQYPPQQSRGPPSRGPPPRSSFSSPSQPSPAVYEASRGGPPPSRPIHGPGGALSPPQL